MHDESPKYVIVSCGRFGTGNVGWRLHEVDRYCFAENYGKAKLLVERWNEYGYGKLAFMVKYENWLSKGGPLYDGRPYTEERTLLRF